MFEDIDVREEEYALQMQRTSYAAINQIILSGEGGDGALAKEALDCKNVVDEALVYITSAMFSALHT